MCLLCYRSFLRLFATIRTACYLNEKATKITSQFVDLAWCLFPLRPLLPGGQRVHRVEFISLYAPLLQIGPHHPYLRRLMEDRMAGAVYWVCIYRGTS